MNDPSNEETTPTKPHGDLPNARWLQALSVLLLIAFSAVTAWVLHYSDDEAVKGGIVQTWNNLAIAVGAFWLGSSSGGKRK